MAPRKGINRQLEITMVSSKHHPINFFKGHPSSELLPAKQIAGAYQRALLADYASYDNDPENRHPLTYGNDSGNLNIRRTICVWNDRLFHRSKETDVECVNLTAGASYGFANILSSVTDTSSFTKRAFIVSPTYFLINPSFIDAGFENKLTAVLETPEEEYEIDLKYLQEQLEFYDGDLGPVGDKEINIFPDTAGRADRKIYRYVMYLVPTFSNPGGLVYSTKTRTKLIELARKHDMLIISDDVYEVLDFNGSYKNIPRFCCLDRDTLPKNFKFGNTISNATVSKFMAPGLRFGWQETVTPSLVRQLAVTGANQSGGSPGHLASFAVNDLITTGEADKLIASLNIVYKSRSDKLKYSIKKYLPSSTKVYGGDGGYFVWVRIETNIDHTKIVKILAEEYNVILASGDNFEVCGDVKGWGKNCVRLAISYLTEEHIEEGIKKWGEVLRREDGQAFQTSS